MQDRGAAACLTLLLPVTTAGNVGEGGLEGGKRMGREESGNEASVNKKPYPTFNCSQQGLRFILSNRVGTSGKRRKVNISESVKHTLKQKGSEN